MLRTYEVTAFWPTEADRPWAGAYQVRRIRARSAEEAAKAVLVDHCLRWPDDMTYHYDPLLAEGARIHVRRGGRHEAFEFTVEDGLRHLGVARVIDARENAPKLLERFSFYANASDLSDA